MTHRQFEVWQEWLLQRWNKPDLTQQYLAMIRYEIAQVNSKRRLDPENYKLKFKIEPRRAGKDGMPSTEEIARITAESKAQWRSRLAKHGGSIIHRSAR